MSKKPRIVGIVQARMGSTRLPAKVLKEIAGKPMLWHILNRLQSSKLIDEVVIASTIDDRDAALETFAKEYKFKIYRGSVDDIVDRYYNAAIMAKADVIVRTWGDCPLLDPIIFDKTIAGFLKEKADYANNFKPATYPVGISLEIYSLAALKSILDGSSDRFYREYPFQYIYDNLDKFKVFYLNNDKNLSDLHWTVDYPEDLEMVRFIYKRLYKEGKPFRMEDVLELIKEHPELREMNKGKNRNIEYHRDLKERGKEE